MTRRTDLLVWALLALLLAACQIAALLDRPRFAGLLELTSRLSATRAARAGLLLGWMWLGWHLFAR